MPTQMTPAGVRVVDPVLTEYARGYRQPELIATRLAPIARVMQYGGNAIEFDASAFAAMNLVRAPGSNVKRIQYGHVGKSYSITPKAVDVPVPREHMRDASAVPGIDLGMRAVNTALKVLQLEHERATAALLLNPTNYATANKVALTGNDRWTNYATATLSNPIDDIETGIEQVRQSVGTPPNTMMLSAKAFKALKAHPSIIGSMSTNAVKVVTRERLEELFNIAIVVGSAITTAAVPAAGTAPTFVDVWGADVLISYVSAGANVNAAVDEPSHALTYLIEDHPYVEDVRWDADTRSWVYGVSFDNAPVLCGQPAGYLIEDAGLAP